jgi:hypothetical protein
VQRDETFEIVREMCAPFRQAAREGVVFVIERVPQVIDAGQQAAEELAIVDDAADRNAAEADAVITLLAPDQALTARFAAHAMVSERDLERGVDGFGAGVREEHMIEPGRRDLDEPLGELECERMSHLKRWRVVERCELTCDRIIDLAPIVSGIHAPQSRDGIENAPTVVRPVVHAVCTCEQTRIRLELTIRRKRHPEGVQRLAAERIHESSRSKEETAS